MTIFSKRPILHEKAVQQALDAMRSGRTLRAHPLQICLIIQSKLTTPYALEGDAAVQVAIFDYLRDVITGRLSELRQPRELPQPDFSCTEDDLLADFSHNNRELEAWSLLYYRYVCVDSDFSMQQIALLTGRDPTAAAPSSTTERQPPDANSGFT